LILGLTGIFFTLHSNGQARDKMVRELSNETITRELRLFNAANSPLHLHTHVFNQLQTYNWYCYIIIQLTPHWGFSVTDYIKYYDYLCYLLRLHAWKLWACCLTGVSGVTMLFNNVDNCEQCGPHNIVRSCFHQYCSNLIVFSCVDYLSLQQWTFNLITKILI
jgi:hypothetical protein